MADLKISQFVDGGAVQETDSIAAVRGGVNTKVTVGTAAAYDVGASIGNVPLIIDINGVAGLDALDGSLLYNLNAQAPSDTLTALGSYNQDGFLVQTALNNFTAREITGTTNQVTVTDGDGVDGNPVISLPQDIHTGATPQFGSMVLSSTGPILRYIQTDVVADAKVWEFNNGGSSGAFTIRTRLDDFTGGTVAIQWLRSGANITGHQFTTNSGDFSFTGGDMVIATVGKALRIKEGTGGFMGTATMVAGVATVTISGLTSSDRAFTQLVTPGGTMGARVKAVCTTNTLTITAVSGAGSTVTSETSTYNFVIHRPSP